MIPYEDLVAALANWRARNGLPTGPADYLGEPPPSGGFAADLGAFATPASEGEVPQEGGAEQYEAGYGEGGYAEGGHGEGDYAEGAGGFAEAPAESGDDIVDLSEDLLESSVVEEGPAEQVMPDEIYAAEEADSDYVVPFSSPDEPAAQQAQPSEAGYQDGGEDYEIGIGDSLVEEEYAVPPGADEPVAQHGDPTAQLWMGATDDPSSEAPPAEPPPAEPPADDDPERQ